MPHHRTGFDPAGKAQQQRNAYQFVVDRQDRVADTAVRAHYVAMIRAEQHQRVLSEAQIVQLLQYAPYLVVDVLHHAMVYGSVFANAFRTGQIA